MAVRRNLLRPKKRPIAVADMVRVAAVAADMDTTIMRKLQQQVKAHAVVGMAAVANTHKKDSYLGTFRIEFLFPR